MSYYCSGCDDVVDGGCARTTCPFEDDATADAETPIKKRFTYSLPRSKFHSDAEYKRYKSRIRVATLQLEITQLGLVGELTTGEVLRALCSLVQDHSRKLQR